ncbi:hypothetical protein Q9R23_08885 [Exiguobacterium sp. BRG2]|uniref:hypothetical protein n=1 Tax=Exiguobacterium sp. BRG2 TaxID=2962584 RepID=UPI00288284F6|nr:hypothetical protein [Exiguobacterium sp. BRG2]MDT0173085.1 hypothetical protein [Exiguobacterium sp. BRG2]
MSTSQKEELKRLGIIVAVATTLGTLGNLITRKERKQLESMQIKDMTGKQFARLQLLTK